MIVLYETISTHKRYFLTNGFGCSERSEMCFGTQTETAKNTISNRNNCVNRLSNEPLYRAKKLIFKHILRSRVL